MRGSRRAPRHCVGAPKTNFRPQITSESRPILWIMLSIITQVFSAAAFSQRPEPIMVVVTLSFVVDPA